MPLPIKDLRTVVDPHGRTRVCEVIHVERSPRARLSTRTEERIAAGIRGLTLPCTKFSNLLSRKP